MKKQPTHFMATVKVGPKGQVVIPKEIREMFGIEPGDSVMVMADSSRGIAIHKQSVMEGIAKAIFEGKPQTFDPDGNSADLTGFASAIEETTEKGQVSK